MVNIDRVRVLSLQIEDEDIEGFISIVSKLLLTINQAGFKKTFDKQERITILNIAEALGLDGAEECNLDVSKNPIN
jgi:hypothetical protein